MGSSSNRLANRFEKVLKSSVEIEMVQIVKEVGYLSQPLFMYLNGIAYHHQR